MAIGENPAHIEELRIGGGINEPDGGADFERDGAIKTTGAVSIMGGALSTFGVVGNNPELTTNGAFEGPYTGGVATGWSEVDSGDVLTLSEETSDVYEGSSSQKYERTTASAANIYLSQAGIALTAGNLYRLSLAVKVLAGAITKIHLLGSTGGSQNLLVENIDNSEWTVHTFDFRLEDDFSGTITLRIGTAFNDVATFLIDALSLKSIDGGNVHAGADVSIVGDLAVEGNVGSSEDPDLLSLENSAMIVRGDVEIEGGDINAGSADSKRGVVTAWNGSGTTPGCLKLASENGTPYFVFVENDGTLRIHNAKPTSNTDGTIVGAQF